MESEPEYKVAYVASESGDTKELLKRIEALEAQNQNLKDSAIKAIKAIKQMENKDYSQSVFCKEHTFNLDGEKFYYSSEQLRRAARIVENEFETGYIKLEE